MNETITNFFKDLDGFIGRQFGRTNFEIMVVGFTALTIAEPKIGRQTKDIDALKTDFLSSEVNEPVLKALESEFGKKAPACTGTGCTWTLFRNRSFGCRQNPRVCR